MSVERILNEMANKIVAVTREVSELRAKVNSGIFTRAARMRTISAGEITLYTSASFFIVAPEAGVADDLDTINVGLDGKIIFLVPYLGSTITLKHGTGNIALPSGLDKALSDTADAYMLLYDENQSAWIHAG